MTISVESREYYERCDVSEEEVGSDGVVQIWLEFEALCVKRKLYKTDMHQLAW